MEDKEAVLVTSVGRPENPSYDMGTGLASSLQWNQPNSHTGQDHQMLNSNTSSRPEYETSARTWTYCPTLQGRVLSVVMHQVKHPVPIGVLSHLFSSYGVVETIFQSLNQHGRQVLIQYKHGYMADNALRATHGWYLYRTYCQLDIRHADHTELQTLSDYSCALFSEINNEADHLSNAAAMPQDKVSDCCHLVTPHMNGHTSEQQVQSNVPVFHIVTNGTHEQKQCDDKHDTSTRPNERVIEQPTVLNELPSVHDPKVAVQLCNSEVVQAATMVRQGNSASSSPLVIHADDLQLPTSVQDVPDLFVEMPVYDVYEEDTNASLNCVVELFDTVGLHKQYEGEKPIYDREEPHGAAKLSSGESDNELLAMCFNKASDNALSEEAADFIFSHGHVIHANRSIKLTNEKSTQAASVLSIHEAIVHCHDERSELNIKKQDVLINKHDITSPCDLHNDKEVPFVLHYQLPLSSTLCIWDPGIDLFSYKKLYHFVWIPLSAIPLLQQLHNKNISSMWEFSIKKGRQVQWDPGTELLLYELWWLQTLSKGSEYAMWHLLAVKFGTQISTYFIDSAASMCCPSAYLIQQGRNVAAVLHFLISIFNDMHYCQTFQKYNAMSSQFHWYQDFKFNGTALWLITFNPP